MKIAIVINTSWNIYNFRAGLIRTLQNQGHEIIAFAPRDEYSDKLKAIGCRYEEVKMDSRGAHPIKDFKLFQELRNKYLLVKPDLILHYTIKPNIYGTFAAALSGIPCINNVCGLGTSFLQNNFVSKIALGLYKLAFRFPKKVFFQNIHDQKFFIDKRLINKDKSSLLPGSGVDIESFVPEKKSNEGIFSFLLISRLIHDKGIFEYVEAVKILKLKGINADFKLLGPKDPNHRRGISEKMLTDWIKESGIDYLGSREDVRAVIKESDCVVLPSYREGTPRTLLEGAGMAKPLIATDVPGCNNIVEDGFNGLLCKKADPVSLAEKMEQMFSKNSVERLKMGINSRRKAVLEFDEKIVIDSYLREIKQAC